MRAPGLETQGARQASTNRPPRRPGSQLGLKTETTPDSFPQTTPKLHFRAVMPGIDQREQDPTHMRQTGTVKFFNTSKGFGFITPDNGQKDVFVHVSALERSGIPHLQDGQKVSFDTEPDRQGKGPKAVNLQLG
jgi:CspA family cold shock protein